MRTILVNISFTVVTFVNANVSAQPAPVAAPTKLTETNPTENPHPPRKPSRAAVSRIAEAIAETLVDAEVRTYLGPVPMTQVDVTRAQKFESDVIAAACADLDADGTTDIITVSR